MVPLTAGALVLSLGFIVKKRKIGSLVFSSNKQTDNVDDVTGIQLPEPATPYVKDQSVVQASPVTVKAYRESKTNLFL
jgi:hypothetical protein